MAEPTPPDTQTPAAPRALVRRLLLLAWRRRWAAAPAIVVTLLGQALLLISLAAQGLAIDLLRTMADENAPPVSWRLGLTPPESWSDLTTLLVLVGITLYVAGLAAIAGLGQRIADEHFVQACVLDLRTRMYEHLQRLGCSFFDKKDTGELVQNLTADTQRVRTFLEAVMVRMLVTITTFVVFLAFMLTEHTLLTLVTVALLPVQVGVMIRYGRKSKPEHLEKARRTDRFVHHYHESILGTRVVRSFARERERLAGSDVRSKSVWEQGVVIDRIRASHVPVIVSATIGSSALLLVYGGYLVILGPAEGGLALGTFWIFRGLLSRLSHQAEAISMMAASFPDALAGAERVFRLLDHPEEPDAPEDAPALAPVRGHVTFDSVWFAYGDGEPVLRGVSFDVPAGQTVAIVGPTGSGKSTLLSLIARMYDPTEGRILFDGADARERPLEDLRRAVAMVFQEPFLFSNTIARNVAYGSPGVERERVLEAIEDASATEVLHERELGLETVVGERGQSLSGGQRQRLTLARALIVDAPILVLDDATGSVDPVTEGEIQRALDTRMRDRTTFIVAHRLSTLRRADQIIVLERGEVVDVGTHHELLERDGHYRAAALIQLSLREDDEDTSGEGAA